MKISWARCFTFYNKTVFYYKVKIIFFFISQIQIYWLHVYISIFSIGIKLKRHRMRRKIFERIDCQNSSKI